MALRSFLIPRLQPFPVMKTFVSSQLVIALIAYVGSLSQALTESTAAHPNLAYLADCARSAPENNLNSVLRWNQVALDASGLDHTPVVTGESRVFGEQLGPCRAARALAIVHIAMSDAINAGHRNYDSYTGVRAVGSLSMTGAVSQAAHDTLVAMFPSQAPRFDALLNDDLATIRNKGIKRRSIKLGRKAATAILRIRLNDGAEIAEPRLGVDFWPSDLPGRWRQDPISRVPVAMGAHWYACKPFVMTSTEQFRAPIPPSMGSVEYAQAFDEVKRLGGDGVFTPTERTPEQTHIGIFWAYDGTPSLCAPPRLYNQIARHIAQQMGSSDREVTRLLTLINVAMADAGMAIWESKYFYEFWRPITGIREADSGTGPTGEGDGNDFTAGDATFQPLGAPASNLNGPNFTPPFPAYPSGHAGFGGALFQILRRFYGTDEIPFTFVSDEFNGITQGHDGQTRPLVPRHFSRSPKPKKRTARAGFTWGFTGASIRQRASLKGSASLIMSSTMPSVRAERGVK